MNDGIFLSGTATDVSLGAGTKRCDRLPSRSGASNERTHIPLLSSKLPHCLDRCKNGVLHGF
jgi:hypothetical protein